MTATRLPTPSAAVANAVTVLDGNELRAQGLTYVTEALRRTASVAIVQAGSYGTATSLFLRGGESDYVKVLVDGVPVNAPGGDLNLAALRLDEVDRIEIVRGPASVVYGSDAMSGVIQIFTRRGTGRPRVSLEAQRGSRDAGTMSLAAGTGGRRVQFAFDASRFLADGAYTMNSRYRDAAGGATLTLTPDARTDATLTVRHRDGVLHFPTDGAGRVRDANQRIDNRRTAAAIDAGRRLGRVLELRAQASINRMIDHYDDGPDTPADTLGPYGYTSHVVLERHSADLRVNATLGRGIIATLGGAGEHQGETGWSRIRSQGFNDSGDVHVARSNRAAYAQIVREGARVAVTAGARLDDNQAFGRFDTWRAGITWRPVRGARLRAAAGTAFKEPTFVENYERSFAIGNPNLKPERSRSWEAGADVSLAGGRVVPSVTWYDQRFRDLIQYTFLSAPGDPSFFNVADAKASGLEAELRVAPGRGWSFTGTYSFVRTAAVDSGFDAATFAQGERLLRRPTHTLALTAGHRFRAGGSASVTVRAVGSRDDLDFAASYPPPRVELSRYTTLDASVVFALSRRIEVSLRGENLRNARYEEIAHFPGRLRTLWMGLRAAS